MNGHREAESLLDGQDRAFLKELARQAVAAAALGQPPPDPVPLAAEMDVTLRPPLTAPRGAFVTLTMDGQLRGCIGYIEGIKPLYEAILDNARSAAVADPRFEPVSGPELAAIELEISALTPLNRVSGPQDIVIGRHGVVLVKGGRRAVFLPQVATEQGWDLDTTLTHLALKAGLDPEGWRRDTEFLVFEADVF